MKSLKLLGLSMLVAVSLIGIVACVSTDTGPEATERRNIMYYADWSVWGGQNNFYPHNMPNDMYTHINYAFLDINKNGNLVWFDRGAAAEHTLEIFGLSRTGANAGLLPAFRALRAENPNVKIGISVGGWSKSGDFSAMAADKNARATFVDSITKFLEYTGMDFVDIDWEYPAYVREGDLVDNKNDEGTPDSVPADKKNYITLMKEVRAGLDALGKKVGKYYELSVALPMNEELLEAGIDVKNLFKIIDFANLMTYDVRGAFDDVSGHHAPLYGNPADPHYEKGYNTDRLVQYMIAEGAPRNKLVIGVPFYTRGWEQVENVEIVEGLPGLFASAAIAGEDTDGTPSRGAENDYPGTIGENGRRIGVWAKRNFETLHKTYPGLIEYWDDVSKAPYMYNGSAFFTFDNERSILEKTQYVHDNNLGGIISWMASNDGITDVPKQRDALTTVIYQGLYGDTELPHFDIIEGDLDISVDIVATSTGYEITVTNNEVRSEMDSVLAVVEKQRKTVLLPKLYIDNSGIELVAASVPRGTTVTQEGNLTVVDFASTLIDATLSVTVQLDYAQGDVSIDNLASIEMTQRVYNFGAEMSKQVVYTK